MLETQYDVNYVSFLAANFIFEICKIRSFAYSSKYEVSLLLISN